MFLIPNVEDFVRNIDHRQAVRDMTRFSTFVITEGLNGFWELTKNRSTGERLGFFSFQDAFEYIDLVGGDLANLEHKGFTIFNSPSEIVSYLDDNTPRQALIRAAAGAASRYNETTASADRIMREQIREQMRGHDSDFI